MKKAVVLCVCILLTVSFMTKSALADADSDSSMVMLSETVTCVDESTYYIERIYVPEVCLYSNIRTGTKTAQGVHSGKVVFTLSVTGQFTYDGISAKATSASGGINVQVAGASLNSSNAYTSGASAIATVSVSYLGSTLNKTVTLTCDANGNLS